MFMPRVQIIIACFSLLPQSKLAVQLKLCNQVIFGIESKNALHNAIHDSLVTPQLSKIAVHDPNGKTHKIANIDCLPNFGDDRKWPSKTRSTWNMRLCVDNECECRCTGLEDVWCEVCLLEWMVIISIVTIATAAAAGCCYYIVANSIKVRVEHDEHLLNRCRFLFGLFIHLLYYFSVAICAVCVYCV